MLTVDEVWLTHADRLRNGHVVTANDIRLENSLFEIETLLQTANARLPVKIRMPDPAVTVAPTRLWPVLPHANLPRKVLRAPMQAGPAAPVNPDLLTKKV